MLTVAHFVEALTSPNNDGDQFAASVAATPITAAVIDSREAHPGSAFFAFAGENTDGHAYVDAAFERGAVVAVVERPSSDATLIDMRGGAARPGPATVQGPVQLQVDDTLAALQRIAHAWRRKFDVTVVGITGSVGKTTTKELTARVLSRRFRTLKSEGNYNNEIGLPLTLLRLRPEHEVVVLEMGMYVPGDIALLCRIAEPQIGVLTLVGQVHMERTGSRAALVAGKRELVEALPETGIAILNADEPLVMGMAPYTPAQVMTYGLAPDAALRADDVESRGLQGIVMTLHYAGDSVRVRMPLLGRHSVHTALRATAVGLVTGMAWEEIVSGLQQHRDELRLLAVTGPFGSTILDDTYNASPASTMAALALLQDLNGRRIAVLGDMLELGSAETEAHRKIGIRAAEIADVLVAVGKLARIAGEEALAVGMPSAAVHFAATATDAIPLLSEMIEPGDAILIKGSRGGRLDRIVTALTRLAPDQE